jgi:CTP:molybdopterin cytidylyltransferase MocA
MMKGGYNAFLAVQHGDFAAFACVAGATAGQSRLFGLCRKPLKQGEHALCLRESARGCEESFCHFSTFGPFPGGSIPNTCGHFSMSDEFSPCSLDEVAAVFDDPGVKILCGDGQGYRKPTGAFNVRADFNRVRRMNQPPDFHALVLAGSRGGPDPVAEPLGLPFKALVPVAGRPMLARVVSALSSARGIGDITLVGIPEGLAHSALASDGLAADRVACLDGQPTPSRSAGAALDTLPASTPALITTADHALLRADIVEHFLALARSSMADVVVGLVKYEHVLEACPGSKRTVTRFRDGGYCGCNLFAIMTPEGRRAVSFWQRVEDDRKHPVRIARAFGFLALLRYLTGRLSIEQAMERVSRLSGAAATAAVLPYGEAAVDVDKPEDLATAEALALRSRSP